MKVRDKMDELLTKIARKHLLVDDLIEVGIHEKDFYDCPKACIREALRDATKEGGMIPGSKANKDGLHICFAEKRVGDYVVYELRDGKTVLASAYGGAAVMVLGAAAELLSKQSVKGLDWLLLDEREGT